MDSIMLKNVNCSDAPWRVFDERTGSIIDRNGRLVAIVPPDIPRMSISGEIRIGGSGWPVPRVETLDPQFFKANKNLVASAPELLAALKEAAYHLDRAGTPLTQEYYDLINRASGGTTVQPTASSSSRT